MDVLIITKNIEIVKKMRKKFKNKFMIHEFSNEEKALNFLLTNEADLIIVEELEFEKAIHFAQKINSDLKTTSKPYMIFIGQSNLDAIKIYQTGYMDFLKKPLLVEELLKKVEIFSNYKNVISDIISYENIKLDELNRSVYLDDEKLHLTKQEFDILLFFMKKQGILLNKKQISMAIWHEYKAKSRKVDLYVSRLKKKIPILKENLQTERSFGYKLRKEEVIPGEDVTELFDCLMLGLCKVINNNQSDLGKVVDILNELGIKVLKVLENKVIFISKMSNKILDSFLNMINQEGIQYKIVLDYVSKDDLKIIFEEKKIEKSKKILEFCAANEILASQALITNQPQSDDWNSIGYYEVQQLNIEKVFQYKDANIKRNSVRKIDEFKAYIGEMYPCEKDTHYFIYKARFKTRFLSSYEKNSEIKLFSGEATDSRSGKIVNAMEKINFKVVKASNNIKYETKIKQYDSKKIEILFTPLTEINEKDFLVAEASFKTQKNSFVYNKNINTETILIFDKIYYFIDGVYNFHSKKNIMVKLIFPIELYNKIEFTPIVSKMVNSKTKIYEDEILELLENKAFRIKKNKNSFEVILIILNAPRERLYGIAWNPYINIGDNN